MYITNNNVCFSCSTRRYNGKDVVFDCDGLPDTISGAIELCSDNGFVLAAYNTNDFLRTVISSNNLTLTNMPEPVLHIPTLDELLAAALDRIDGKCSAAIYSGVTVGDKHYKLTATAQGNLATAQAKVDGGAESVIYAADNEEPTLYTAEQINEISDAAYKWGVVNTSYYAKLQKWIARETDEKVLQAIDYGVKLPDDLMQELGTLLAGAGINLADYAGMLG